MKKRLVIALMALAILIPSLSFAEGFENSKDDIIYGVALSEDEMDIVDKKVGADRKSSNVSYVDGSDLSLIHI